MKNIKNIIVAGFFIITTTSSMAATKTVVDSNWICISNASSSDVATDIAADDRMNNISASAVDAFAFATANCRDCTKITCEAQSK
jgi:hypothetical protein